jgi:hypothetical protein
MLKGLADSGRTVITTIHQPSSQMWDLFDKLLVCFKTEKKEEMIRNDKK